MNYEQKNVPYIYFEFGEREKNDEIRIFYYLIEACF